MYRVVTRSENLRRWRPHYITEGKVCGVGRGNFPLPGSLLRLLCGGLYEDLWSMEE
jgi:hypothetical protein